jgi:penicillin amidase
MPGVENPSRGFVVTANNRVAADDFPYPLAGTWSSGHRAKRIRERLEPQTSLGRTHHRELQMDAVSLRAVECVPALCAVLEGHPDENVRCVVAFLKKWNGDCDPNLVAPAVFNVFFVEWCKRVAAERFPEDVAPLLSGGIEGLAAELLQVDHSGWFTPHGGRAVSLATASQAADSAEAANLSRKTLICDTFRATLGQLAERFGDDPSQWTWGRLHRLDLKHVLVGRGDLGDLLNQGGAGVPGDATTVCNTGRGPDCGATIGAGYRMICDLGELPVGLWAVDCQSQSGHPGSSHYGDQFQDWLAGRYHFVPLDRSEASRRAVAKLRLEPQ